MLGFTAASPSSIPTKAIFGTPKVAAMGVKLPRHVAASSSYFSIKAATFAPVFPCAVFNLCSFKSKYSRIEANCGGLTESSPRKKHALILVSDNRNLDVIGRGLQELGYRIVSTGETASALESVGVCVTKVDEFHLLYFPNMIHGAHLNPDAMMDELPEALNKLKIGSIELVVANLAKFRSGTDSLKGMDIKDMDILGIPIIATAAETDKDVLAVVDPSDYPAVLEFLCGEQDDQPFKRKLDVKALYHLLDHFGDDQPFKRKLDVKALYHLLDHLGT